MGVEKDPKTPTSGVSRRCLRGFVKLGDSPTQETQKRESASPTSKSSYDEISPPGTHLGIVLDTHQPCHAEIQYYPINPTVVFGRVAQIRNVTTPALTMPVSFQRGVPTHGPGAARPLGTGHRLYQELIVLTSRLMSSLKQLMRLTSDLYYSTKW